ncbi:MAG: hypothetical protein KAT81_01575, partial [Syntrophobacterales bacterium]|nr:hypothetical protein [Syntrophobacterales bacterium]
RQAKPGNSEHPGAPGKDAGPTEAGAADKSGVTESRIILPEKVQDSAKKEGIVDRLYNLFR